MVASVVTSTGVSTIVTPPLTATLIVNVNNPIVKNISMLDAEKQELIINQIYYLAMISYKKLSPEELSDFSDRNAKILTAFSK